MHYIVQVLRNKDVFLYISKCLLSNGGENFCQWSEWEDMDEMCRHGYLYMIQRKYNDNNQGIVLSRISMFLAAKFGHTDVVKWLHSSTDVKWMYTDAIKVAIMNGHFHIGVWLYNHDKRKKEWSLIDWTAMNGCLDFMKWYHKQGGFKNGDFLYIADSAAWRRDLEMVKWLYENEISRCSDYCIRCICISGPKDIGMWLLEHHK